MLTKFVKTLCCNEITFKGGIQKSGCGIGGRIINLSIKETAVAGDDEEIEVPELLSISTLILLGLEPISIGLRIKWPFVVEFCTFGVDEEDAGVVDGAAKVKLAGYEG